MSEAVRRALNKALAERQQAGLMRRMPPPPQGVDFCSNDYLGLARDPRLRRRIAEISARRAPLHGATGSRLISGNHPELEALERRLAEFYRAEAALVFSSGFAANMGLLASLGGVANKLFCDRLLHASAIDGCRLSGAERIIFAHNDMGGLESGLNRLKPGETGVVVVESLYSMDGDFAPLARIVALAHSRGAGVVVDEAHANGVMGAEGRGAVAAAELEDAVLARVVTFGKALGLSGGAVLCSAALRDYLVNFARPFVFSTGPSPLWAQWVRAAFERLPALDDRRARLRANVDFFRRRAVESPWNWLPSKSWIQCLVVPGPDEVRRVGETLQQQGIAALPIRAPTVPSGQERIRVCLHAHNTPEEIDRLFAAADGAMRASSTR
ncbi:MAG: 8-amino-7-oxononanoate synthase [Gammaproteobacteria bacterium]|nr:8-amino-7-oxononanoate synthase [Gammaproteobacteria bacterium]